MKTNETQQEQYSKVVNEIGLFSSNFVFVKIKKQLTPPPSIGFYADWIQLEDEKLDISSMILPDFGKTSHQNYPVIWKILGLFSSPISGEIDHP